jgi:hypothetical protein
MSITPSWLTSAMAHPSFGLIIRQRLENFRVSASSAPADLQETPTELKQAAKTKTRDRAENMGEFSWRRK